MIYKNIMEKYNAPSKEEALERAFEIMRNMESPVALKKVNRYDKEYLELPERSIGFIKPELVSTDEWDSLTLKKCMRLGRWRAKLDARAKTFISRYDIITQDEANELARVRTSALEHEYVKHVYQNYPFDNCPRSYNIKVEFISDREGVSVFRGGGDLRIRAHMDIAVKGWLPFEWAMKSPVPAIILDAVQASEGVWYVVWAQMRSKGTERSHKALKKVHGAWCDGELLPGYDSFGEVKEKVVKIEMMARRNKVVRALTEGRGT